MSRITHVSYYSPIGRPPAPALLGPWVSITRTQQKPRYHYNVSDASLERLAQVINHLTHARNEKHCYLYISADGFSWRRPLT